MRSAWRAVAILPLALVPAAARAHLVSTGLGPFYDGISHLLVSPDDLLLALALALLAGLRGPGAGRAALLAVLAAWVAGGLAGLALDPGPVPGWLAWVPVLLAGGLAAADAPLPGGVVAGLAAASGALHGWSNGEAMLRSGAGATGLLGACAALAVVATLATAAAVVARDGWRRIAARVAGSWLAAIALLALGWSWRAR